MMIRRSENRYFDLSTLLALGIFAFLLISMPGGCGDSDDSDDDEDVQTEAVAEPTAPPMMEIVDPEPGDLQTEDAEPDEQELPAEGGEEADEPDGEEGEGSEPEADEESAEHDGTYVVQEGDTLYGIAVQFNVSMEALMAANGMDDPDALQLGQELQIPE